MVLPDHWLQFQLSELLPIPQMPVTLWMSFSKVRSQMLLLSIGSLQRLVCECPLYLWAILCKVEVSWFDH